MTQQRFPDRNLADVGHALQTDLRREEATKGACLVAARKMARKIKSAWLTGASLQNFRILGKSRTGIEGRP
eukprot:9482302-Pyramimonas_sp.AAC.1